jgi:DNA-binding CsgD family transcriptional regulator
MGHAYTLARLGRLDEGLVVATRASDLAQTVPVIASLAGVACADILLLMGRYRESDTWCDRTETTALARGEQFALLGVWHLRAQRHVQEGRLSDACDLYVKLEETSSRLGIGEPCAVPWARHAIMAHLRCGRIQDGSRVVGWLERSVEGIPCRWPRIAAATGRAALAELHGDPGCADGHFKAALALHDQVELPLERVETLLQYGAFLRRANQPVRARSVLAEAFDLSAAHGAQWLLGQVHDELTVAGGRRRRGRGKREQLTAQEERVAHLAASGWSNREIAHHLSVSANTVGTHLKSIYAKRGIHTRRQLMVIEATAPH